VTDGGASSLVFRARGLGRRFATGEVAVRAIEAVDLEIVAGEVVLIAGPSGSGKSTLLHLLGGIDRPDAGSVALEGRDLASLSEHERTLIRRRRLGFVFQEYHLIPVLSALENVEYPLWIDGVGRRERRDRAQVMLDQVGLGARLDHRPDRLSGGERQRVAIARALVHSPAALLADEPTGNLDSGTAAGILDLLLALNRERGATIVLATHDPALLRRAPRRLELRDGRLTADTLSPEAT
jgi:predicted ABC-type transport system involved in lysophospholipase L1 biosynthesis ATPase subunit